MNPMVGWYALACVGGGLAAAWMVVLAAIMGAAIDTPIPPAPFPKREGREDQSAPDGADMDAGRPA